MRKNSLKNRILTYLRKHGGWVASGTIQRLAMEKANRSPQNAGRRCRELVEDGDLEVTYIKNHAWYRATKPLELVTYHTSDGTEIKRWELSPHKCRTEVAEMVQ